MRKRGSRFLSVVVAILLAVACAAVTACGSSGMGVADTGVGAATSERGDSDADKGDAVGEQGDTATEASGEKDGDAAASDVSPGEAADADATVATTVTEDGEYSTKDEVAAYIHEFGHLPGNYISKTKAGKAGWVSSEGNLWDVLPGRSIGGSRYWNDDGALPEADGRTWTECDINYQGGYRGPERIVFSNDGLVYYTPDHYQTWEQLY